MSVPILCPFCRVSGTVPDHSRGHHCRCPKCGSRFKVPELLSAVDVTPVSSPAPVVLRVQERVEAWVPSKKRFPFWLLILLAGGVPLFVLLGFFTVLFVIAGAQGYGKDVELTEAAANSLKKTQDGYDWGGLVLLRRGLTVENGPYDVRISGVIENRRYTPMFNTWIVFKVYDESGKEIGEAASERTNDFPGQRAWHFTAICPRKGAKVKLSRMGGHWYSN